MAPVMSHFPPELTSLPGRVVIKPDADDLVDALAHDLIIAAMQAVNQRGEFHLALSGGSTPRQLFRRLATDPDLRNFPWPDTHIWVVDERCVDLEDDHANWRMMREHLLDHVTTPAEQLHPIPALENRADETYARTLHDVLPVRDSAGIPRLDFVLLGMGDDGHTASLFPNTGALIEHQRLIMFNDGQSIAPPRPRVTMTYPILNAARAIAVLVAGQAKHQALRQVAEHLARQSGPTPDLPITAIHPAHSDADLTWYLDNQAAGT